MPSAIPCVASSRMDDFAATPFLVRKVSCSPFVDSAIAASPSKNEASSITRNAVAPSCVVRATAGFGRLLPQGCSTAVAVTPEPVHGRTSVRGSPAATRAAGRLGGAKAWNSNVPITTARNQAYGENVFVAMRTRKPPRNPAQTRFGHHLDP